MCVREMECRKAFPKITVYCFRIVLTGVSVIRSLMTLAYLADERENR